MGLNPRVVMRLFTKLARGDIKLPDAKKQAIKAKCEDRAIKAWLAYEKLHSEEDLKEKYGADIFKDPTFMKEAASFGGHVRKNKMPPQFQNFILNRQRLLRFPVPSATVGWSTFLSQNRVETPLPPDPHGKPQFQVQWQQKDCLYRVICGKISYFQIIFRFSLHFPLL